MPDESGSDRPPGNDFCPQPDLPHEMALRFEDVERLFLDQLARQGETLGPLWELVTFYACAGRRDKALSYMQRVKALKVEDSQRAHYYVSVGQLCETLGEFDEAIPWYRKAVAERPQSVKAAYYAHNNLAYCLNLRQQYIEAEKLCRIAIWIAPDRHNAHKNLGISFQGQGRFLEAAESFLIANRNQPGDPRALRHLEELLARQPEVKEQLAERGWSIEPGAGVDQDAENAPEPRNGRPDGETVQLAPGRRSGERAAARHLPAGRPRHTGEPGGCA